MNILITGSEGFIGKHLVKALSDYNPDVVDLNDRDLPRSFENVGFLDHYDVIVHLAAEVNAPSSVNFPGLYFEENVVKFADMLMDIKKGCKVIFFSTGGALYGSSLSAKEEQASLDKCPNPYAASKFMGEWLVKYYVENHLILRLANVVGEGQDEREEKNVFTHFAQDDPIVVYGIDSTRDFIDVDKVCEAVRRGIERDIRGTYNIGSGTGTSILELANKACMERGVEVVIKDRRPGEVQEIILDTTLAHEAGLL